MMNIRRSCPVKLRLMWLTRQSWRLDRTTRNQNQAADLCKSKPLRRGLRYRSQNHQELEIRQMKLALSSKSKSSSPIMPHFGGPITHYRLLCGRWQRIVTCSFELLGFWFSPTLSTAPPKLTCWSFWRNLFARAGYRVRLLYLQCVRRSNRTTLRY